MSENFKKITGKNPKDFQPVAYALINNPDVELFRELVEKDDFLFDFVKQNVAGRLESVCNEQNYKNLFKLLKYYSPSYEDFIVSVLVRYADEDLTDEMLNLFENGSDDEKTYCAKFFSYIQDPLALDYLKANCYSQNSYLASNCASTLGILKDESSYNLALEKLKSDDDFEKLDAVRFLVSYGKKDAVDLIIKIMNNSPIGENIASEIPYLESILSILKRDYESALFVLNLIINGLGEVVNLAQIFDFQLYEVFEYLIRSKKESKSSLVLLNAIEKFEILTENDEYLYDEPKDVKQEVLDIKNLLNTCDLSELTNLSDEELNENSLFVFNALDLTKDTVKVRELLKSSNQTIVLKSIEVLKQLGDLSNEDKALALNNVTNENIRSIIQAI